MILLGKPVVNSIEEKIKIEIANFAAHGVKPFLAVILVGEDPASILYTRKKKEKAEEMGIGYHLYHLPEDIGTENTISLIKDLNQNKNVHGIIVQLPLPDDFDQEKILKAIDKEKDVDNLNGGFVSPTIVAIFEILDYYKIDLKDKKIVILGRGKLVGQPLEKELTTKGYHSIVCDSGTDDLSVITKSADIIFSGVGKPGLIKPELVSSKTIVIDAGTAESNGSTVGDLSPEAYSKVASYTPVPGGVGPITVISLLKNVVAAAKINQ